MKKKDLILILAVVLAAFAALGSAAFFTAGKVPSGMVHIYVNNQLFAQEKLGQEKEIPIIQPDGRENILHLLPNGFYMARANCATEDCIHQGLVTTENYHQRPQLNRVVCAHNHVYVELVLTDQTPPPDMPDI